MNIVIVNQPTRNRGDEAAHKSFMRSLLNYFPNARFTVLFHDELDNTIEQMKFMVPNIKYINFNGFSRGLALISKISLLISSPGIGRIHPLILQYSKHIRKADYIICAPGGISMGGFQNWVHIFILHLAKALNKKTIYFSRSFGPFPEGSFWYKLFKKRSHELIKAFDYLSIRDQKTMELADQIGVDYVRSIDSVFLDNIDVKIPNEIVQLTGSGGYIVFVPNELIWHPAYDERIKSKIDEFYLTIMNYLLETRKYSKIVMLPQIFNDPNRNDKQYFETLRLKANTPEKVIVINDIYGSDIQQMIIAKARMIIGARYHSIVFAINNNVPFIALSYEHKIRGLLHILNIGNNVIDIENIESEDFVIGEQITLIDRFLKNTSRNLGARELANRIANSGFKKLVDVMN